MAESLRSPERTELTDAESLAPPIVPQNAVYTHCWCEENIYLLGRHFLESRPEFATVWDAHVVVISNEDKTVRLVVFVCIQGE
jgi:hypothetical protein